MFSQATRMMLRRGAVQGGCIFNIRAASAAGASATGSGARGVTKKAAWRCDNVVWPRAALPVRYVPQGEVWVRETFGRFTGVVEPGLRFFVPFVNTVKSMPSTVITREIDPQSGITSDNTSVLVDGVIYLQISDPQRAAYNVDNPVDAAIQMAQAAMRAEIGKLDLASMFRARETLGSSIAATVNKAGEAWGVRCTGYFIKGLTVPPDVERSMQDVAAAERERIAKVTRALGEKEKAIHEASGEAGAITIRTEAQCEAMLAVARTMQQPGMSEAVRLELMRKYLEAFRELAKHSTTTLLPAALNDPAAFLAQAMSAMATSNKNNNNNNNNNSVKKP